MPATRLIILDSGAFGSWTKGHPVDLDAYIKFCVDHPTVSYYVNLDVIPGRAGRKPTPAEAADACQRGWENYKRMAEVLPKHKLIPVFHQDDDYKWIDKYLNDGVTYLGISPANDSPIKVSDHQSNNFIGRPFFEETSNPSKADWMAKVKKFIFDSAGRPIVRTHGFAVTSYRLMQYWEWHSVDSASWKVIAGWGSIYVPQRKDGEYVYDRPPTIIAVSPRSTAIQKVGTHIDNMMGRVSGKRMVEEYLEYIGMPYGKYTVHPVSKDYKLNRLDGVGDELWFKKGETIIRTVEPGIVTSNDCRAQVNARFMMEANRVLPIAHIYFAGAPMPYPLEWDLGKRLLSFHDVGKGAGVRCLHKHLDVMEKRNASRR